ncbi:hypothetical protein OJE16_19480 [Pantoea tagorei]
MNDEFKGKSGKVKVMYVRDEGESGSRAPNPRTGKGGGRPARQEDSRRSSGRRSEEGASRKPRSDEGGRRPRSDEGSRKPRSDEAFSPWRTVSRSPSERTSAEEKQPEQGGKVAIDPEVIRRQRQEETRVYGENACQALFQSRPEAIVRAWFVQSVTPRFRDALRWLAANRKAYHVVEDAELAKASGTEHHGGVCFIIKKTHGHGGQRVAEPGR